jgi:hypothetical protein
MIGRWIMLWTRSPAWTPGQSEGAFGGTTMRMHDRREHAANWRTETVNPTAVMV